MKLAVTIFLLCAAALQGMIATVEGNQLGLVVEALALIGVLIEVSQRERLGH